MARIEDSIDIAATPSAAFRFCHDPTHRAEWDERVTGIELLTPGPVRRGTLLRIDAGRSGKFLFSWDAEYAGFQFPRSSTLRVIDAAPSSPFVSGTEKWDFGPASGGTRFSLAWEYKPRSFFARIADALGQRAATRRAIRHSLANLKQLLESS